MQTLRDAIAGAIVAVLRDHLGATIERVVVEYPPATGMGDLASPIAFEMAKRLRRPPRAVAQEIAAVFPKVDGVRRVEVGGAGYLNVFLDRGAAVRALARELSSPPAEPTGAPVVVEHTNINPNKAAHIGHLRNAVLGDTLARALRFTGRRVEVQNYIDDTGVQVADLIIGFREIMRIPLDDIVRIPGRFDHVCWDLYARVTERFASDPDLLALRPTVLKALEEGRGEIGALAAHVTRRIVHCHLDTMARIGVSYDLLPWEKDVLAFRFWDTAFSLLKERGAISRVEAGERQGCWVMALTGARFADLKEGEKILVRSNGTVTYVGKDIGYQLWKFGLLRSDFRYEEFRREAGGHRTWTTTHGPGDPTAPSFGRAERVYNVIDVRQAYLQAIVAEGLKALGYADQAGRSVHFAYEMVALTPSTAAALGLSITDEDRKRPYVEMSGRRGLGIKADDLLDALEGRARAEVASRNPELTATESDGLARAIAVGALRYFMVKYTRNKVLAFDFDEALAFEGETGPYLQYAAVRAAGIFEKMGASGGPAEAAAARAALEEPFDLPAGEAEEEHWALALQIARFRETVALAIDALELSQVAKYGFNLAQRFNSFYHKYPVMKEGDRRWKGARVTLTWLFLAQMRRVLDLMGIPVPARM